jgi:hypothetical protein
VLPSSASIQIAIGTIGTEHSARSLGKGRGSSNTLILMAKAIVDICSDGGRSAQLSEGLAPRNVEKSCCAQEKCCPRPSRCAELLDLPI